MLDWLLYSSCINSALGQSCELWACLRNQGHGMQEGGTLRFHYYKYIVRYTFQTYCTEQTKERRRGAAHSRMPQQLLVIWACYAGTKVAQVYGARESRSRRHTDTMAWCSKPDTDISLVPRQDQAVLLAHEPIVSVVPFPR
ncbi:hypothetical protein IQ07DRAFT_437476 [Pyrenochaeta sp. DS3sAY3a]|nr:hypothetical protein IQ07DRAFT_437476 [Pyrenochaeta sp. DS3sAY3a]